MKYQLYIISLICRNSPKFKRYLLDSIIVYLILCVIGGAHESSDMADGGALRQMGEVLVAWGTYGEYWDAWGSTTFIGCKVFLMMVHQNSFLFFMSLAIHRWPSIPSGGSLQNLFTYTCRKQTKG